MSSVELAILRFDEPAHDDHVAHRVVRELRPARVAQQGRHVGEGAEEDERDLAPLLATLGLGLGAGARVRVRVKVRLSLTPTLTLSLSLSLTWSRLCSIAASESS